MVALTTAEVFLLLRLFTAGAEPLTEAEIKGPLRALYDKLNEHAAAIKRLRAENSHRLNARPR